MQAHFWARSGNWLFSDWRDLDFSRLRDDDPATAIALQPDGADGAAPVDPADDDAFTPQSLEALKLAMTQEGVLPVDDIPRVMAAFHRRMDPRRPAKACGACGVMDVPLDVIGSAAAGRAEAARIGVTRFVDVQLGDALLAPLAYSPEEAAAYDIAVPPHIVDTPANREHWTRYKRVKSSVLLPAPGAALATDDPLPVRMHLYHAAVRSLPQGVVGWCASRAVGRCWLGPRRPPCSRPARALLGREHGCGSYPRPLDCAQPARATQCRSVDSLGTLQDSSRLPLSSPLPPPLQGRTTA